MVNGKKYVRINPFVSIAIIHNRTTFTTESTPSHDTAKQPLPSRFKLSRFHSCTVLCETYILGNDGYAGQGCDDVVWDDAQYNREQTIRHAKERTNDSRSHKKIQGYKSRAEKISDDYTSLVQTRLHQTRILNTTWEQRRQEMLQVQTTNYMLCAG